MLLFSVFIGFAIGRVGPHALRSTGDIADRIRCDYLCARIPNSKARPEISEPRLTRIIDELLLLSRVEVGAIAAMASRRQSARDSSTAPAVKSPIQARIQTVCGVNSASRLTEVPDICTVIRK